MGGGGGGEDPKRSCWESPSDQLDGSAELQLLMPANVWVVTLM